MIIYKTTNLINDKIYVGQDQNNKLWYYGSGNLIKLAINKYGKENFKKETIEECVDIDDLNDAEIFWIWHENSLVPNGYNITKGGGGCSGMIPWNKGKINCISKETRQKMSITRTGKHPSAETRKKMSKSQKGRIFSEESKQKMRENSYWKGKHLTEETKRKLSKVRKGKKPSKETRLKMSESLRGEKHPMYGKHHSEKSKLKISNGNKGKIRSDEFKQKISKANIGKIISKEQKLKISESLKGHIISKETRQKMSEAKKGKKLSEAHKLSLIKYHISKNELIKLYITENKTQQDIAHIYGCSRSGIAYKVKKYNISKL